MNHDKESLEALFAKIGLKPALREKAGDFDIFYGTGFSSAPHLAWRNRGETVVDDFPLGAFVTFWWIGKDDKLLTGRPVFHEPVLIAQSARIDAARKDAMTHLGKLKNARPN
jgi:hypothetical protein